MYCEKRDKKGGWGWGVIEEEKERGVRRDCRRERGRDIQRQGKYRKVVL